jgi:hypothetical protein
MSKRNRQRRQQRQQAAGPVQLVRLAFRELRADGSILRGPVYHVPVYHDGACALVAGRGRCNCDPRLGEPQVVPIPEDN